MGVLSDLVVATEDDVKAILATQVPSQSFDGIDIKGIGPVKLAMLHGMVTGKSFEDLLPEYEPIAEATEDGPWVLRLPDEIVNRLARMSEEDRVLAGSKWAQIEEFALDGWDAPQVQRTFDAICETAGRAESSGRGLYLWMSL